MITISEYVDTRKLPYYQLLVKRFDGRFTPFVAEKWPTLDKIYLEVTFDENSNVNKFYTLVTITEQPYF